MAPDYDKKVPDYNKKVPEFEKKVPESEKKVPESDKKYLKEAGGHIGRNVVRCTDNNKDEDNSPNNADNTNHQASSQTFREILSRLIVTQTPVN